MSDPCRIYKFHQISGSESSGALQQLARGIVRSSLATTTPFGVSCSMISDSVSFRQTCPDDDSLHVKFYAADTQCDEKIANYFGCLKQKPVEQSTTKHRIFLAQNINLMLDCCPSSHVIRISVWMRRNQKSAILFPSVFGVVCISASVFFPRFFIVAIFRLVVNQHHICAITHSYWRVSILFLFICLFIISLLSSKDGSFCRVA